MATTRTPSRHNRMRLLIATTVAAVALPATAATGVALASSPTDNRPAASAPDPRGGPKQTEAMLDTWLQLWNGDYAKAPGIISPDIEVHAALMDGGDGSGIRGPEGMVAWIGELRAAFPDLVFTVEVGPLIDGRYAALRWIATGTYAGGLPGAQAAPGTVVTFTGTDTLRIYGGKFVEYWLNSDSLLLMQQLDAF
ncbi:ester cyclase [Micromonospora sp. LOL_023]|uniref:ester cyclase n=1 Tax=Micromonospora sp. LOL_023 TaxID=3345418 RepID=UPI003A87B983